MFKLDSLVRENIKKLTPYSSARDEFSGDAKVFLDANENPFHSPLYNSTRTGSRMRFNRYPDPHQKVLKEAIGGLKGINPGNIFLGNGSDECIDLLFRCFCEPGRDNVIINPPTYGMYETAAAINDVSVKRIPLLENFQLDLENILLSIDSQTKIIWICSPNNPTGNCVDKKDIETLLDSFEGLLVIDEAYIDFVSEKTLLGELERYPNLVILQTFIKAWGLAGLRLGMAFGSMEIMALLEKVKPPYNINCFTQSSVSEILRREEKVRMNVNRIISLRTDLAERLSSIPSVKKIYPSSANFLLVKMDDAGKRYDQLLEKGIVVRNRSNIILCDNCLRITVGSKIENDLLLAALTGDNSRIAIHQRNTNETAINVDLNIDGNGFADVHTGVGFFDHMLEQVARHGNIDLSVDAIGDLEVDEHHTIEDTGIALGEAFAKALGDKRGTERYGFALPMDDAEAKLLLDFGGRTWVQWDVKFNREKIGDMPTEMFFHFFKSFSDGAKCNLHVACKGENEHHMIEAIFKAFAKAIKMAVKKDPFSNYLPTTKGVL